MNGNRITVVHLITKLEMGGAQLNTLYTVENLNSLRFDVHLLCGPGGVLKSRLADDGRLIVVSELDREVRFGKDLQALAQITRFFKSLRPMIVHTHSSKAGILGRLAAHLAGVPVVIHSVHGFSFSPFQSHFKRFFYRFAERACRRLTTHFVFVSNCDIDLARRKKLVTGNYSLIRSGFPLEKFSGRNDDPAALRAKYDLPAGCFVCGIVAPFKPQKGLFHLAAIADIVIKRNPTIFFFIAGDGAQRHELENELQRRGIACNFRLPGFIRDVENAMDCFDIGISTALWEGLPQSLVQLRLKKKALVASDIPGNREVIRDGENGFLLPVGDHERFAAAILRLSAEPGLRQKMESCGGEDFSEWSADVLVARQEELYQRMVVRHWTGT
jgi:glycosyltransferase involved in cell wall biosynthesis